MRENICICEPLGRDQALVEKLCRVWEQSVRATHLFLSEEEIQMIAKFVPEAVTAVPVLVTATWGGREPVAFMGIDGEKVEMLFVVPEMRGMGLGKELLEYGFGHYHVRELCVNEQNPQARGFYEHMGFEVVGRSELDEQGNPYPLLYMRLPETHGGRDYSLLCLREHPELAAKAAGWFSGKWGIPEEAYYESIQACAAGRNAIPQWYLVMDGRQEIAAGAGIIENDFHERKDLAPNLCALYVEECCRGQGIARRILDFARRDAGRLGISALYLVTDHREFYERCGWRFLTMVRGDDGLWERMYTASTL